jgi:hypothetical protein
MRPLDELRRLQRNLRELRRADAAAEESARFELTQSTRHFSRKTQKVLDDTMALSATLMRAGEVEEAKLLIAEVEREVREEQAALHEAMNEVNIERSTRRRKIYRLKLVRMLAAMVAGASVMALSIGGIGLASLFLHDKDSAGRAHDTAVNVASRQDHGRKRVKIAGVVVKLTPRQLATFNDISSGSSVNNVEMQQLLTAVLPQVPVGLVGQVQSAIVGTVATVQVPAAVEDLKEAAAKVVKADESQGSSKPKDEPSPEPSQEPEPSPSESPSNGGSEEPSGGDQKGGAEDDLPPIPDAVPHVNH